MKYCIAEKVICQKVEMGIDMRNLVRVTNSRQKVAGRYLKKIILLFLACLVLLVLFIAAAWTCRTTTITVENTTKYSDDEIISQVMTKSTDKVSFLFWLRYKLYGIQDIPFVEKVTVKLTDKNSVVISAYQKLVTGCVKIMNGYMYFDREGIVVESSSEQQEGIPVITGLKFNKIVLYEKMEIQDETLFDSILELTKLVMKYELPVTDIGFNSSREVTVICDGNKILMGKKEAYDAVFSALPKMLESLEGRKYQIDMRRYSESNKTSIAKPLQD